MSEKIHPETLALRGFKEQTHYNEHNQALFLTSSFTYPNSEKARALFLGEEEGYTYSRTSNPTVTAFANRLALLEGAEAAQATSTGMAAIQATFLSFLKAGDHLVASKNLFGTTLGLINMLVDLGIEITYVSLTNIEEWKSSIKSNTKMFFLETPSNPLVEIADIEKIAHVAHAKEIILAVDNTFCSPVIQQPIKLGADLSIQSATKLIDGQGRVFGGCVLGSKTLIDKVNVQVKTAGQVLSPFNAWILLSGIETIFVRLERQCSNALKLAQWLETHPKILQVYYPGLKSHPQYDLILKQQNSGGIVLSFKLKGGQDEAWKLIDNTRFFSKTGNLGDVKSIITHPYTTTHARVSQEAKEAAGITQNLIRISAGLEHIDDLLADLERVIDLA